MDYAADLGQKQSIPLVCCQDPFPKSENLWTESFVLVESQDRV